MKTHDRTFGEITFKINVHAKIEDQDANEDPTRLTLRWSAITLQTRQRKIE